MSVKVPEEVEVYFKRSFFDALFRRYPRRVVFSGMSGAWHNNSGVHLQWGEKLYSYPWHKISRVRWTK